MLLIGILGGKCPETHNIKITIDKCVIININVNKKLINANIQKNCQGFTDAILSRKYRHNHSNQPHKSNDALSIRVINSKSSILSYCVQEKKHPLYLIYTNHVVITFHSLHKNSAVEKNHFVPVHHNKRCTIETAMAMTLLCALNLSSKQRDKDPSTDNKITLDLKHY